MPLAHGVVFSVEASALGGHCRHFGGDKRSATASGPRFRVRSLGINDGGTPL